MRINVLAYTSREPVRPANAGHAGHACWKWIFLISADITCASRRCDLARMRSSLRNSVGGNLRVIGEPDWSRDEDRSLDYRSNCLRFKLARVAPRRWREPKTGKTRHREARPSYGALMCTKRICERVIMAPNWWIHADRTSLTVSERIFCLRMPSANRFRMHFAKAAGVLDAILPQYRCGSNSIARKANCDAIVDEYAGPIASRNLRRHNNKRDIGSNSQTFNRKRKNGAIVTTRNYKAESIVMP